MILLFPFYFIGHFLTCTSRLRLALLCLEPFDVVIDDVASQDVVGDVLGARNAREAVLQSEKKGVMSCGPILFSAQSSVQHRLTLAPQLQAKGCDMSHSVDG